VLYAELSDQDLMTMPRLLPGLVRRCDLRGSAGWGYRGCRFLLASGEFGGLGTLPWLHKSTTKQLVAVQRNPGVRQPSLFEAMLAETLLAEGGAPEAFGGIDAALLAADGELDLVTYVVAHSLDAFSGEIELVLGRPRLNLGGGPAWHWYQDLLTVPLPGAGLRPSAGQVPSDPSGVPDAPVRLRRLEGGRSDFAR